MTINPIPVTSKLSAKPILSLSKGQVQLDTQLQIAEKLVEKYGGKNTGELSWMIHCPHEDHEDKTPSCSVSVAKNDKGNDKLLVHCHRCDAQEPQTVWNYLVKNGDIPTSSSTKQSSQKANYQEIWDESSNDTVWQEYMENRGVKDFFFAGTEDSIRFNSKLKYYDANTKKEIFLPCIVAAITNSQEELQGIQRIYLNEDGTGKAKVADPKKALGTVNGGKVVLEKDASKKLHIIEGIETALAVKFQLDDEEGTFWSAVNSGNLVKQELPSDIEELHLWVDKDAEFTGEKAAYALAKKAIEKNSKLKVFFHIPLIELGKKRSIDWLDYHYLIQGTFKTTDVTSHDAIKNKKFYKNETKTDLLLDVITEGVSLKNLSRKQIPVEVLYNNKDFALGDSGIYCVFVEDKERKLGSRITRTPCWLSSNLKNLSDNITIEDDLNNLGTVGEAEITYIDQQDNTKKTLRIASSDISSEGVKKRILANSSIVLTSPRCLSDFCNFLAECYWYTQKNGKTKYWADNGRWVKIGDKLTHTRYDKEVLLYPDDSTRERIKAYSSNGSLSSWLKEVFETACSSYGICVALTVGLTAPLLHLLELPSIVVAINGRSGIGKTTAARIAISPFGHPSKLELNGDSSKFGIVRTLSVVQSVPNCIDETQLTDSKALQNLVYHIGNNGNAAKGTSDGGLRQAQTFSTVAIFTGEQSINTATKFSGTQARIIHLSDINFLEGLTKEQIVTLRASYLQNYGLLGEAFFGVIKEYFNEKPQEVQKMFIEYQQEFETTDQTQIRQTAHYAAMALAITFFQQALKRLDSSYDSELWIQKLREAIHKHWDEAIDVREQSSIARRTLDILIQYIRRNHYYFERTEETPQTTEILGEWQKDYSLALIPSALEKIFPDEDATEIKRQWDDRGWLHVTEKARKEKRFTSTCKICRKPYKVLKIIAQDIKDNHPEALNEKVLEELATKRAKKEAEKKETVAS